MTDHTFIETKTNAVIPSTLLTRALQADAVASAGQGLLMVAGAGMLDGVTGLPTDLLRYAGLFLLPYAALVGWMGFRPSLPRWLVWTVILGNVAWAAESVLLAFSAWVQPTGFGIAFVLAQAFVVALFAALQFLGLKRSQ
jgi:hypothetical protein